MIDSNSFYFIIKLYFVFVVFVISPKSSSQTELQNALTEGKHHYEELSRKVSLFGTCWKLAISDLHEGCNRLTDEVQSRLALSFANCFLQNSGSQTCPCSEDKIVSDCLTNVDERIFSTYREFYTHTRSICYFLNHQVWQESTENTIQKLSHSSEKMKQQLSKSTKAQATILQMQQISLGKQQQLINNSEISLQNLNHELERSRTSAKAVVDEFKSATSEQRLLIFEVFDHIKKLEALVMGEFAGMFTFVYYFLAIIMAYILTSARQVAVARFWLFMLVTLNGIFERIITVLSIPEETTQQVLLYTDGPLYYRVWLCRKVFCIISFTVLAISFYSYRDYNIINNRLLLELQRQHSEIQTFIKSIREPKTSSLAAESLAINEQQMPGDNATVLSECVTDSKIESGPPIPSKGGLTKYTSFFPAIFAKFAPKSPKKAALEGSYQDLVNETQVTPKKKKANNILTRPKIHKDYVEVIKTSEQNIYKDIDILEGVSPITRYNLRRRTMTPPQSLSVAIKKAVRASKENSREILEIMDLKQ